MVSYLWYPTYGILTMVSYLWYPTYGILPICGGYCNRNLYAKQRKEYKNQDNQSINQSLCTVCCYVVCSACTVCCMYESHLLFIHYLITQHKARRETNNMTSATLTIAWHWHTYYTHNKLSSPSPSLSLRRSPLKAKQSPPPQATHSTRARGKQNHFCKKNNKLKIKRYNVFHVSVCADCIGAS